MTKTSEKIATIIRTFSDDIYIISNKTPDEIQKTIDAGSDMVRMPNGAYIHKKSIASMQDIEDYNFQTEQKVFHKKGYHIKNNSWHDTHGALGINAHLERISGSLKALPQSNSLKKLHE